jgi:integrase
MRKTLTDRGVAALKPRAKRYSLPDPELSGHYVRITPAGAKSFVAVTRGPAGQIWTTIGPADGMAIKEARTRAREILDRIRAGKPAIEPKAASFAAIVADWRKRHVDKNKLRSAPEINRLLDRHVLPVWRDREFVSIRRSDITALLDHVEDRHAARQADYVLNVVRSIMNWFATRHDDYNPPVVRGMRRQSPHAQARSRVLDDGELRAIWNAAEMSGAFGAAVRLCLLTAQRRAKVLGMRWADVSAEGGQWTVPKAPREKDTGGMLVLPELARAIIAAQPMLGDNPFVFAGRAAGPINGISKFKARLDKASGVSGWRLHDLRRTARSLMARAGVPSEHASRVLGHAIGGIEGTYNQHRYVDEKRNALARLAGLVDTIVSERANVVPMARP